MDHGGWWSGDVVCMLGKTRGKGNARDLLLDSTAVVVSDDYNAYRNLSQPHQLCCAHILRKLRDVAESRTLPSSLRTHCTEAYHTFREIYADIVRACATSTPKRYYARLRARLTTFATPHQNDPKKVQTYVPKCVNVRRAILRVSGMRTFVPTTTPRNVHYVLWCRNAKYPMGL
jgi:hypothetical protein